MDLPTIADELLTDARAHSAGRATRGLAGGRGDRLRQLALALVDGAELSEHENPGEATLLVWSGRVTLSCEGIDTVLDEGSFATIPRARHALRAETDAVVVLSLVSA